MRKRFFTLLYSIIMIGVPYFYAQNSVQVSPINIAIKIVEDTDTAEIFSTCRYYGLIETVHVNDAKVFVSHDGTELRVIMNEGEPIIEVITKQKIKQIKSQLEANGFVKSDISETIFEDSRRQVTIRKDNSTLYIKKKSLRHYNY